MESHHQPSLIGAPVDEAPMKAYHEIVADFGFDRAKKISSDDRFEQLGEVDVQMTPFTYGEITFEPIYEILRYLKQEGMLPKKSGNVFYDLGSGFGKPSLAAALSLPEEVSKCIGIEYLDGLYQESLNLKAVYDKYVQTTGKAHSELIYLKDDFLLNTQWAEEADIIFANATCFEDHMVTSVSKTLCDKLKAGAIVIITTKTLQYPDEGVFRRVFD